MLTLNSVERLYHPDVVMWGKILSHAMARPLLWDDVLLNCFIGLALLSTSDEGEVAVGLIRAANADAAGIRVPG